MFPLQKATQVTAGPVSSSNDDLVAWIRECYSLPAPRNDGRPTVRANMVTSIDGAATADGKSGGLAGAGDKLIFHALRGMADAIVVGASTALVEGYRAPEPRPDGQVPLLVLASRSLSIPSDYEPIGDPGVLIATCSAAPPDERARLTAAGATLIDCGADTVEPAALLDDLQERGVGHVLCEGGPRLLADFVANRMLDELAVTLHPGLVGGNAPRIAHGPTPDPSPAPMRTRHILGDDDGYLYMLWSAEHGLPSESR